MKREGRINDVYLYYYYYICGECGWRGKWEEMMMKEPCDYYSHIIMGTLKPMFQAGEEESRDEDDEDEDGGVVGVDDDDVVGS